MKKEIKLNHLPINDFTEIKRMISEARHKAQVSVNSATVELYWETGHFVSERLKSAAWGDGIIEKLVHWLAQENVSLQGFSRRGIYRMVQFYDTYMASHFLEAVRELLTTTKKSPLVQQPEEVVEMGNSIVAAVGSQLPLTQNQDMAFVTTVLTQISWSNHLLILSGNKLPQERLFYLLLAKKERLSYRELKRQIDSSMYERTTMGDALLSDAMKSLPQEVSRVFRDTYSLELLGIPSAHNEGDLQNKIVSNLKVFFLEFGRDFTFVGEKFRLQVGNHDYFVDLLFYHRELRCLVAVELKAREFDPRDLGQLEFYLEALDRDVKKAFENPSIGILLCKEKDETVVQYALSRSVSPAMIAEYNRLLPDKALVRQRLLELLEQEKMGETL